MTEASVTKLEPFITIDQLVASNIIPIPKDTLYRWAERGKITAYKVGRRWLFRASEVIRDLEGFKNHGVETIQKRPERLAGRLARGWR